MGKIKRAGDVVLVGVLAWNVQYPRYHSWYRKGGREEWRGKYFSSALNSDPQRAGMQTKSRSTLSHQATCRWQAGNSSTISTKWHLSPQLRRG